MIVEIKGQVLHGGEVTVRVKGRDRTRSTSWQASISIVETEDVFSSRCHANVFANYHLLGERIAAAQRYRQDPSYD